MIRRLKLSNWRAYEALDLELRHGTTFIVAPNGIGKTSILLGLLWGLFGESSDVDARTNIRAGASEATVEVELALPPDDRVVSITRSVQGKGKPKAKFHLDGKESDEAAVFDELASAFGADIAILRRLAFMLGGAHETATPFDLGDHLSAVFGVTALRDAADAARGFAKAAKSERERIRIKGRDQSSDVSQLREEFASLEAQSITLDEVRSRLSEALDKRVKEQATARGWAEHDQALMLYRERVESALEDARHVVSRNEFSDLTDAIESLDETEVSLRAELTETQRSAGAAAARLAQVEQALQLLETGSGGVCPTCLRPLNAHDAAEARTEQEGEANKARGDKDGADLRATDIERQLRLVRIARGRLGEVGAAPEVPVGARSSIEDTTIAWEQALGALQQHDTEVGRIRGRSEEVSSALHEYEDALLAETALEQAHRREAIAAAAIQAFDSSADSIAAERIEPITREVQWRWKRVFGAEGLQLRPDGSIVRQVGERELPFQSLSGGEKVWALLVTRLLVLSASTRVGFLWLDEPLEHLDPRLRGLVARALVKAAKTSGLRQVVVTTYEQGLAQQLVGDEAQVTIRYVRSSDIGDDAERVVS